MARIDLTETERWAILNALRTATDAYRKDADSRAFKPDQFKHLRTQYLGQADHLMALYERLEAAETITLAGE